MSFSPNHFPWQNSVERYLYLCISGTDTVTVTSAAEDLIEMEKKLSNLSGADEARVASIKEQVQNGSFQIDVAKIAEKLIQQEQELL